MLAKGACELQQCHGKAENTVVSGPNPFDF